MTSAISAADQEKLANWFSYHPAADAADVERYRDIRCAGRAFAEVVMANCPDSADRTVALRAIREAVMWSNAAVACGGK